MTRRLMYAARHRGVLPRAHIDDRLLTVKDARPKYYTEADLHALHEAIADPNFRIATTRDAICVFNNTLFVSGRTSRPSSSSFPWRIPATRSTSARS